MNQALGVHGLLLKEAKRLLAWTICEYHMAEQCVHDPIRRVRGRLTDQHAGRRMATVIFIDVLVHLRADF